MEKSNGTDRPLLLVDQFEELFTLVPGSVRSSFVKSLLEALEKTELHILMMIRADFYGHVTAESRALSHLVEQDVINLGPLTRDELQRTIEEHARLVGFELEDGLVTRILDDAGEEPGNLPLVEFALVELAKPQRRRGKLLAHAGYSAIEGISGAIAKRADEEFDNLSEEQRAIAPGVLTRLVRVALPGQ